jgi:hypothetical protein
MPGELSENPGLTSAQVKEFIKNPLTQLPMEFRPIVWDFWAFNSHLLTSQLALCTRLRHWIEKYELDPAALRRAFEKLNSVERAQTHKYASDLLMDLAVQVQAEAAQRRRDEEAAERRKAEENHKARVQSGEVVTFASLNAKARKEIGAMPS